VYLPHLREAVAAGEAAIRQSLKSHETPYDAENIEVEAEYRYIGWRLSEDKN
jgi:hypothetical protein